MKNLKTKKLNVLSFLFSLILFTACQKEIPKIGAADTEFDPPVVFVGSANSGTSSQIIYAGQTINAGIVSYSDIDTNGDQVDDALKVEFQATGGWQFSEINFFIGNSLSELPVNKSGNPMPGQFPYKSYNIVGQTSFVFTIPFSTTISIFETNDPKAPGSVTLENLPCIGFLTRSWVSAPKI